MKIIALDLGLSCGVAWLDAALGEISSRNLTLAKPRDYAHVRVKTLHDALTAIIREPGHRPDLVAYEKVEFVSTTASAHSYGALEGMLLYVAAREGVPYLGIGVATVKKAAGLPHDATKEAMLAAARARWPDHDFKTHDESDARFVAVAAMHHVSKGRS